MSVRSKFAVVLHRMEVHAHPNLKDDFRWSLVAGESREGGILINGYLRYQSGEGIAQAQILGFVLDRQWGQVKKNQTSRDEFSSWVYDYVAEVMYDAARRPILAQASFMDLHFDIDTSAPDVDLQFEKPTKKPEAPETKVVTAAAQGSPRRRLKNGS